MDTLQHAMVRVGIQRDHYAIDPGVYALGKPSPQSNIIVTANYKYSVDCVRSALEGKDAWLLVLDTHGINVWCAAGKGSFGSQEIIRMVQTRHLNQLVTHRRLILPQLGAPGVSVKEVKQATGFEVTYGPVRAEDLTSFMDANYQASETMRQVSFRWYERLLLAPLEWVRAMKWTLLWLVIWTGVLSGIMGRPDLVLPFAGLYLGATSVATVVFPLVLPWLPGRAFGLKGLVLGGLWVLIHTLWLPLSSFWWGHLVLQGAVIGFLGLNFTGSTTYTSYSGTEKETLTYTRVFAGLGLVAVVLICLGLALGGGQL